MQANVLARAGELKNGSKEKRGSGRKPRFSITKYDLPPGAIE